MRGVFFWEAAGLSLNQANPYGGLLAQALAQVGVELRAGHPEEFTKEWLCQNQGQIDFLHLNWPHSLYDAPDLGARVARCAQVVDHLTLARTLGYKIVWTVHNLYPHDSENRALDHLARLAIIHLANAVIVHCVHARDLVQQHFYRQERVFVIPHGHFINAYPNRIRREEARQQLGLADDDFVYFFFGNVRRYKGLERLLEVFQSLPGDHVRLLIAAKAYNQYGEQFVEYAAQANPRVIVRSSRFFANEEFQWLFNAADVGIFPFVNVLTSGSVITALSFGLPVIVPAVGCLPELVPADAGIVYEPADSDGLRQAMQEMQKRNIPSMRAAALEQAHALDWTQIAKQTQRVYEQI